MKYKMSALLVGLSLSALLPVGSAHAQMTYDPANHAYFVTNWPYLDTDISGNDVFVGKDNATNFATVPYIAGLQIVAGAKITQFGNTYAGTYYQGVNIFGACYLLVQGGNVSTATAFDTSDVTVTGGNLSSLNTQGNSTATITGGTISNLNAAGNSTVNINGGTVTSFYRQGTSTVNLKAGTVDQFGSGGGGTVNMTGGKVTTLGDITGATVNVTGGTLSSLNLDLGTLNVGAGGSVGRVWARHGGTINVTGGNLRTATGDEFTEFNISGGNVGSAGGHWHSNLNVSGGTVEQVSGNRASVVDISDGTVTNAYVNSASTMIVRGGVVNEAAATNHSRIEVNGGTISKATASPDSLIYVSGGDVSEFFGSTIYVAGGHVGSVWLDPNGTAYVTGGIADTFFDSGANSTVNVSGGFTTSVYTDRLNVTGGKVWSTWGGRVNITGGLVSQANARARLNISGGTVVRPEVGTNIPVNISGGTVGGFGTEEDTGSFPVDRGIYQIKGTLNLYWSGFARADIVPGEYFSDTGTYSTLTGTLLDGTPVNSLFFLGDGATVNFRGGAAQGNAVMPDRIANGVFTFTDVPTGAWFDPPLVDSFLFTMTDGNRFTGILELPAGFASAFDVRVGNVLLGSFGAGQAVNFADFGFGAGVGAFSIEGIMPGVDLENPGGFPVRLGFNAPFASFTMQGFGGSSAAPEPGSVGLVLLGGVCAIVAGGKAARRRG